jgi:hypothetical protein
MKIKLIAPQTPESPCMDHPDDETARVDFKDDREGVLKEYSLAPWS